MERRFANTRIINMSANTVIFDKTIDRVNLNFFLVTFVNFEIKITSLKFA